jgi:lysozyme
VCVCMNVIVTDISYYQYGWNKDITQITKFVDFETMRQSANGVFIRAGQRNWKDKAFDVSWKNAKGILPRGSYWFYDSRATPKSQAQLWVDILGGDLGEMGLWCDFEERYGGAFGTWRHWYDFIEEVKSLVPNAKIGIYTAYYFWVEKTVLATNAQLAYFGKYPLWIAAYNNTAPRIPEPWKEYEFWQFTDSGDGAKYGVHSKDIDLNVYNGTLLDFQNEYGLGNSPSEPVTVRIVADYNGTKVEYRSK